MKMSSAGFLVLVLVLLVTCSEAEPATEFAEASDGGAASLPCSLAPTHPPDKVTVVLWYRGTQESPVYKYDVRGSRPQHWADASLDNRYFLRVLDDERAVMSISPTKLSDEEMFHCRVDFHKSPTRITHVNLTIVVPPTGVQVTDDFNAVKNGITTAYAEGASLTLTCTATGGKPLAKVSWWRDGDLVTDDSQFFPDRRKSQSVLKIDKLTRSHLLAIYSCEVSNSRLQPPLVVRVAIDMYLRPLEVTLLGNNPEFSAGKRYNITCRCRGSRPPAIITWWKDGVSLEGGTVTVSADGNTTTSTLSFTPTSADHGLILTCKASNQRIPFSEQQRTWMLRVNYPPKVTLTLGHGLDTSVIKEGSDVYFECHLTANPWAASAWFTTSPQWSSSPIDHKSELLSPKNNHKSIPDLKLTEVIEKSSKFPRKFPIDTMRCHQLVKLKVPEEILEKNINSAYPVIHEHALYLCSVFLTHQRKHGNQKFYQNMNLLDLIDRLLSKRAVWFLGTDDHYMLMDGTEGAGGWESVGTKTEVPPLLLENCLSYDEMKLSAFLSVSSHTVFINDGNRRNRGFFEEDRTKIEDDGIIIGLIGTRLRRKNVMEHSDIVKSKSQNIKKYGFSYFFQPSATLQSKCFNFYGDVGTPYDKLLKHIKKSEAEDRYVELLPEDYFDTLVYSRRIALSFDTLLIEANERAKQVNKMAYVHVVGLGLGVWRIYSGQDKIYMDTFAQRLKCVNKHQ